MSMGPVDAPLLAFLAGEPPSKILLRAGNETWTVHQVQEALGDLASRLAGARVLAVLADNGPAWVMADLAAMGAGMVHLPLPAFFSPAQLSHALERVGADRVLTDQPERVQALNLGFVRVEDWQGLALMARDRAPVELPGGTTKISFTSGSTGTPKGVCLGASGLLATARGLVSTLAGLPIDRHLAVLPLALLLENVAGLYAPLLRGAEIQLPRLAELGWRGMAGFDPAALHCQIESTRPASIILVPESLKAWCLYLAATGQGGVGSLRFAAVGGARVDPELLARARSLGVPAYEGYGLTECGSVICLNRPGADRPGTVGRPLPHVAVAVDAAGEVQVSGDIFLGYLGDARRPAGAFASGDLGDFLEDGALALSGRRGNLLVTAYGRNVSPEWVESALLAQAEIAQAMVVGEACPWLGALLVPAPGVAADALARAVARANAGLPDYARIAGWAEVPPFSPAEGLATGNGRPVRAAIFERHAQAIAALYPVALGERPAMAPLSTMTAGPGNLPAMPHSAS